jgi:hypothetical protein
MTTDTLLIGKAAEYLFITRCLIEGITCYGPINDGGRVDALVGVGLRRCQVKAIQRGRTINGLSVRKTGGQNFKKYRYTKTDVDIMVGADLKTMDVYIVPIEDITNYKAYVSISALERGGYKNNFSPFI